MFTVTASVRYLAAALALLALGCRDPYRIPDREEFVWGKVGSWSGRGNSQTSSFSSDTGTFRVQWETKSLDPADPGTFHLALYSAVSGRPLLDAVTQRGNGRGTVHLTEDPRVFYFVIESSGVEWSFTAEEGVPVVLRQRS